nr:retrovirus-related Pol polyprotein from transposon TNT 1-94 [Tanacetum cinerariifolium]
MVEVKVLMGLAEEDDVVCKEGARNSEWVKISIRKVHTFLEMEDNDDRKVCLDYLCIDLNYVKEQRSNLLSKHRNLVHELNACKEQLLLLKQVKLDFLTMQHINTKIHKENKNLRTELKELKAITETWLNSSNKVNKILPSESQRNTTDSSVAVTNSSATDYDSADEFSVCSIPLPPLKKLDGAEPISGPKTIKSILRSKSTFKAEAIKDVTINEPSSAPAKGNKSSSASKVHSAHGAPQDRWSQNKHIELVNIIGNPGARMVTRAMAKQLSVASTHECLFVDFLSEEELKKVSEALKQHGWVDAMQDELN